MLVLSRKKNESIVIGENITVQVLEVRGDKVRLGIAAPRDVPIHREEVAEGIKLLRMEMAEDRSVSESSDDQPPSDQFPHVESRCNAS